MSTYTRRIKRQSLKYYEYDNDLFCLREITADKDSFYYSATCATTSVDSFGIGLMPYPADFDTPWFTTVEDIGKTMDILFLDSLSTSIIRSIKIDYTGPVTFGTLCPTPDKITYSSITYFDKHKIQEIGRKGLKYYVSFPEFEELQEIRRFLLTMIITGLLGICCNLIYKIFRLSFLAKYWRKHMKTINMIVFIFIFLGIITLINLFLTIKN